MDHDDPLDPKNDPFGPPATPILVHCIHCGEEYESYRIQWRIETDSDGKPHGFWCCPIPGCDGKGFGFDIFPVDRDYQDDGLEFFDDDETDSDGFDPSGEI